MSKESFLNAVVPLVRGYEPNDSVREALANRDVVSVVGPSGVGKNSVMETTGLPISQGFTTRQRRSATDMTYRFIESEDDLEMLLTAVASGECVQTAIHPTTGEFYGSALEDYSAETVTLLDVMPKQHHDFVERNLFRTIRGCYVTAPNYQQWQDRLKQRGHINSQDYQWRMQEAIVSLKIGLASCDFYFILNDNLSTAGQQLYDYAAERVLDPKVHLPARRAGHLMLNGLRQQLERSS